MVHRATFAGLADLFALHRRAPDRYPFLLQSLAGHPQSGRSASHGPVMLQLQCRIRA